MTPSFVGLSFSRLFLSALLTPSQRTQLSRLEFIHSRDFIHRDVKPANFVMGTDRAEHLVNVIDFGLAKKFRDSKTSAHIPYRQDDHHGVGTSLFASINAHHGIGEL
jgi:casein kinase I family protein HRR25